MRLLATLLVLAVVVGVLSLGSAQPDQKADLVIVNRGDVFTLDPQRMTYLRDFRMAYALYEGLVRWNNYDFMIEPAVAAALPHLSDDGRVYTFTIVPEARWSNGDPVTAHDFVFTFRRALLPDTASYYTSLLFAIEGAREFFDWRSEQLAVFLEEELPRKATEGHGGEQRRAEQFTADAQRSQTEIKFRDSDLATVISASNAVILSTPAILQTQHSSPPTPWPSAALRGELLWEQTLAKFDETVGVKALDEHTLQITLERPVAYFLDILAMPIALPVHEQSLAPFQSLNARTGRLEERQNWCKAGRLVSNGPYVLERWRFKRDMLLARNPHYHRPEIVMNDSVLALTIEDANTAVLAFLARGSEIDWMDDITVEYAPDLLAQPDGDIHATPAFATEFYSFNCRQALPGGQSNPFADARVRRAFTLAIDRGRIVRHVTRLGEPIARTLIPPGSIPGYNSPQGLGFDVNRARQELRDAGWFDRNGDGTLTNERGEVFPVVDLLWTTSAPRHRWISLEMKAQLERHLGVKVETRGLDARFYREDLRRGNFMLARGSWYGDYGDPTTFLDLSRTDDGNNHRRYSSRYYDDLLEQSAHETDPSKRLRLLEEAERYLVDEEAPLLLLLHPVRLAMYDAKQVQGISTHPRAIQYLWQMQRAAAGSRLSALGSNLQNELSPSPLNGDNR